MQDGLDLLTAASCEVLRKRPEVPEVCFADLARSVGAVLLLVDDLTWREPTEAQ